MAERNNDEVRDEIVRLNQRFQVQREVMQQVRAAIWAMGGGDDLRSLLEAIWQALSALGVSFKFCGVNIIEEKDGRTSITVHNMTPEGEIHSYDYEQSGDLPLMQIWREQQVVYRPDLHRDDPFGERAMASSGVRSIVDMPYSHGTLALSADEPAAFSPEDLLLLEDLAGVLSEGFSRLQDLGDLEARNRELEREVAERRQAEEAVRINLALQRVRNVILMMRSEDDWAKVVASYYQELRELVDFDVCGINFVDLEKETYRPYGVKPDRITLGKEQSYVPLALREAMEMGKPIYRRNEDEQKAYEDRMGPDKKSIVDVPYSNGTIAVNSAREDAFDERDLGILGEFAQVLSEADRRLQDLQLLSASEEQLRQVQKMEAVGELTAGIAHNFNNMLQGIMGNLYLAMLETTGDVKLQLESADGAAHRAAAMVRDLLLFARPDVQRHVESVNVGKLVTEATGICRQTFDRRIELEVSLPPVAIYIEGDHGQLEQVMVNMLLNARDAVEGGAQGDPRIWLVVDEVEITGTEDLPHADLALGTYVRVDVADNGAGMDEQTLARIFEPFFTTKAVDKGTGLGLSTAFSIVQQHGGWLACESEPSAGTTFCVWLPKEEDEAKGEWPGHSISKTDGQTILVIDDEETVRLSMQRFLERYDYEVLVAADGLEGLEIFKRERQRVKLVLLDLSMPRMSGEEVLGELQRLAPELKVVLFTGYAAEEGQYTGVAGVLQKPFRAEDLIQNVANIMQGQ